jgi:hypothetical protein
VPHPAPGTRLLGKLIDLNMTLAIIHSTPLFPEDAELLEVQSVHAVDELMIDRPSAKPLSQIFLCMRH